MLTEHTRNAILSLQKEYPKKRSALIPALHMAQNEKGYLSHRTQAEIADLFGLQPNEVHAVVTFYDMFHEQPVGKHLLHVCKNLSCMLRGSDHLIHLLSERLGIQPGETTADGQFTLIPCECLAACDKAPMMLVDEELVGPVRDEDIDRILEEAKKRPGHGGHSDSHEEHGHGGCCGGKKLMPQQSQMKALPVANEQNSPSCCMTKSTKTAKPSGGSCCHGGKESNHA